MTYSLPKPYVEQRVYDFGCNFIVPTEDKELETLIKQWNQLSSSLHPLHSLHFLPHHCFKAISFSPFMTKYELSREEGLRKGTFGRHSVG